VTVFFVRWAQIDLLTYLLKVINSNITDKTLISHIPGVSTA